MDMQLNQDTIRTLREARAWSQSHLAEVTNLSLRTVQRIEKTGQASLESAKALSSVLDIPLDDLRKLNPASAVVPKTITKAAGAAAAVFAILTGVVWLSTASAAPVMLDVSVSSEGKSLANVQLLNGDNEESEMRVDGVLKLIVVPHRLENGVKLSLRFFQFTAGNYSLIASPEVIVAHNQPAAIRIDTDTQQSYDLVLKPHL